MEEKTIQAHDLIVKAREALRRGDRETARNLGEQAALLDPGLEDAWLVLAAAEPDPEEALAYAQQALEINPSSARALKAVEWAMGRVKQSQAPAPAAVPPPVKPEKPKAEKKSNSLLWIVGAAVLALFLCAVIVFSIYSAAAQPALSSVWRSVSSAVVPTQEDGWAPMDLAKPPSGSNQAPAEAAAPAQQAGDQSGAGSGSSQSSGEASEQQPENSASAGSESGQEPATPAVTDTPASTPTAAATSTPTVIPTEASTATPEFTPTPGAMSMTIVEDTPTSQYTAPTSSASLPPVAASGNGLRWIDVDLTNQRVYAYEGDVVVNSFIVSTGTWRTPTVTGQFKVYVKYRSAPMSGPGYYLPNVPYIMYFHGDYGLHGTYWHNNFGTPMSHGCVNLRTDDAAWLYNWASVGTLVNVHY